MSSKGEIGVDDWKHRVQQDITDLKADYSHMSREQSRQKDDIRDLQMSSTIQAQEIKALKDDLSEIKDDTNWIRRKITGAIITVTITAIIGGIIGIAISNIF